MGANQEEIFNCADIEINKDINKMTFTKVEYSNQTTTLEIKNITKNSSLITKINEKIIIWLFGFIFYFYF